LGRSSPFNVSYQHCCKKNINVNDSQNLAFATAHFVIELLPFDYLRNQKQWKSTTKCISRGITLHTVVRHFQLWELFCRSVVIESSFDPGERLQAPGSLWFHQIFKILIPFILYFKNY
jgi:hypothetical protein